MKIKKIFTKKRIIWAIIIFVVLFGIGYFIFGKKGGTGSIQTVIAEKQNLEQTVLATGQVVSGTDLALGFQAGGFIRQVLVKEGDKVYAGKILALLDQASAGASLLNAQGALAQAKANYNKIAAGATTEDIKVAQTTVDSAKQDLVNKYNGALNVFNDAYLKTYNAYNVVASLYNSYFNTNDQTGIKILDIKNSINERMKSIKSSADLLGSSGGKDTIIANVLLDLKSVRDSLAIIREQCDEGIYYTKVSSADKTSIDTQKTNINTALENVTDLQENLASLKIALQKAEDQLALKKAPATQADLDIAKAQILSAEGQVAQAQANLNNLVIVAPLAGTITQVDIKVGEQAKATESVIVLKNVSDLHSEADVSEANIAMLSVGQPIDYTFDALGPDRHFKGKVLSINPAAIVVSGVVNYKVKGSLPEIQEIKPGMTTNMTVLVAKKENVLAVPSTAIINKNGKQYARVVGDKKTKSSYEVEVQTGLQADGGLVEIISGITEGQEIVTYTKP